MKYQVKVVREKGPNPVTGQMVEYAEEELDVEADTPQAAHLTADQICTLPFFGQIRRTFINGIEHFNEGF